MRTQGKTTLRKDNITAEDDEEVFSCFVLP